MTVKVRSLIQGYSVSNMAAAAAKNASEIPSSGKPSRPRRRKNPQHPLPLSRSLPRAHSFTESARLAALPGTFTGSGSRRHPRYLAKWTATPVRPFRDTEKTSGMALRNGTQRLVPATMPGRPITTLDKGTLVAVTSSQTWAPRREAGGGSLGQTAA